MNRRKFMGLAAGGLGAAGLATAAKEKPVVEETALPLKVYENHCHAVSAMGDDGFFKIRTWGKIRLNRAVESKMDFYRIRHLRFFQPQPGYRTIKTHLCVSLCGKIIDWEVEEKEITKTAI